MIIHVLLLLISSNPKPMFQIPSNKLLNEDTAIALFMQQYLPETGTGTASSDSGIVIQQPNTSLKNEQFSFIVNTQKNTITHSNGINRWLGYTNSHFAVKNYIDIIHPAHAIVQGFYTIAIFELFAKDKTIAAEMMKLTYVSLLALLHKNGRYIYCKKETRPLQVTTEGRIIEYSNEFTIVKDFNNEHYAFRIFSDAGEEHMIAEKIKTLVKKWFEKRAGFSVQELRILKRYASLGNLTSEMVANSFKIEKSTVSTYNKRILNKAEDIFDHRFDNAQKVAEYFKEMDLI